MKKSILTIFLVGLSIINHWKYIRNFPTSYELNGPNFMAIAMWNKAIYFDSDRWQFMEQKELICCVFIVWTPIFELDANCLVRTFQSDWRLDYCILYDPDAFELNFDTMLVGWHNKHIPIPYRFVLGIFDSQISL